MRATDAASIERSLLQRLRHDTQTEHNAMEHALALMSPRLTLSHYHRCLIGFRGFYAPVESRLARIEGWPSLGLDIAARQKLAALDADLRCLGVAEPAALPSCVHLPLIESLADGLGCLYVLEGASLGGRFISRHIQRTLNLTSDKGARFFHGYGERTGEMWRDFGRVITAFAPPQMEEERVVRAATDTFRTMRAWMVGKERA